MALKLVIISGGQTGADRAALDWSIKHELPHGGWCPLGRQAMDGQIDEKYKLKETPTEEPLEKTEWNVRDSDATVIFTLGPKAAGGAQKASSFARKMKKPCLHLHKGILGASEKLIAFMDKYYVRRLNVAGSRECREPGVYEWVTLTLERMKATMDRRPD